jgi:hypothetical protein
MSNSRPQKILLTDDEEALLAQISFSPKDILGYGEKSSFLVAETLAHSILSRKAVPQIRLRYFTDPELSIGTKKSRKQIFEANGAKGEEILRRPHFLPYLQYFIFGPQLPDKIIDEFWSLVAKSDGGRTEAREFSRDKARKFGLNPREACEEFFKLSLECGMNIDDARSVREAVKTIR